MIYLIPIAVLLLAAFVMGLCIAARQADDSMDAIQRMRESHKDFLEF